MVATVPESSCHGVCHLSKRRQTQPGCKDFEFDIAIFDEAHKTAGVQGKPFAQMLFDENINVKRRVFMTATERRYVGKRDDVVSMDDTDVYGKTFDIMSFKQAVNASPPILSDYRVLLMAISNREIQSLIENRAQVRAVDASFSGDITADTLASLIALRRAFDEAKATRAVTFHSSIRRASKFAEYNEVVSSLGLFDKEVASFHIHGAMTTAVRSAILKEFTQSDSAMITNARCLSEGVDIPSIDAILFADPKRSVVDIVQATGRALRIYSGKAMGYVVVPIIAESGPDGSLLLEESRFEAVVRVLRALAANDERIIEYFRDAETTSSIPSKELVMDDGNLVRVQGISVESFAKTVRTRIWQSLGKLVWRPFEDARQFVQSLGLNRTKDWGKYCSGRFPELVKLPPDIPKNPYKVYRDNGWSGMRDWLGFSWRSYDDARKFVASLHLKNLEEWRRYVSGKLPQLAPLPPDIPKAPRPIYDGDGWQGMRHWLGRDWRPYELARDFVHGLGLSTYTEWVKYTRGELTDLRPLPSDIPKSPIGTYKNNGWVNTRDWLGTKWREFTQARQFVRRLGLSRYEDWLDYIQSKRSDLPALPDDIPNGPDKVYANSGWCGWGDWLRLASSTRTHPKRGGEKTWRRKDSYMPFERARDVVRALGFTSSSDWNAFCRERNLDIESPWNLIPSNPHKVYKENGWSGWPDFLGYRPGKRGSGQSFRSYRDARSFARSLKLSSSTQWFAYCRGELANLGKKPNDIPSSPQSTYKQRGWNGWPDWLGTQRRRGKGRPYRPFKEAREFARSLGLKSYGEWRSHVRTGATSTLSLPIDIPVSPDRVYAKDGWNGWPDWLGTERRRGKGRTYRPFKEAREFARGIGLNSYKEWLKYAKKDLASAPPLPEDIPSSPDRIYYENGWSGWPDFLGYRPRKTGRGQSFRSYEEARDFARSLRLLSSTQWFAFCRGELDYLDKRPCDIPYAPHVIYKNKGWKTWAEWLGRPDR